MKEMADETGGRAYGPIASDFTQLPQIFIKEASIVRRSLIHTDAAGMHINPGDERTDLLTGIGQLPDITGMVLTTRKEHTAQNDVQVPLIVGKENDPLLASWQAGLGKVVCWTSDAQNLWAAGMVQSSDYGKFWAQAIRSVARPPMSTDFNVEMTRDPASKKGLITINAINTESGFLNFAAIEARRRAGTDAEHPHGPEGTGAVHRAVRPG